MTWTEIQFFQFHAVTLTSDGHWSFRLIPETDDMDTDSSVAWRYTVRGAHSCSVVNNQSGDRNIIICYLIAVSII